MRDQIRHPVWPFCWLGCYCIFSYQGSNPPPLLTTLLIVLRPTQFFPILKWKPRSCYSLLRVLPASFSRKVLFFCDFEFCESKSFFRYSFARVLTVSSSKNGSFKFCAILRCNSNSSYRMARVLLPWSAKSAPNMPISYIFIWHRALATIWCAFFRPHLPKVSRVCSEKQLFGQNRILSTVSCIFCRYRNPATEILLWRPKGRITRKMRRFVPGSFSPVNSHHSELLHVPTTWWWVVDMWLTPWREC